ncbi:RING finger and SPRY domain-containing [Argiope bruennichi]|uniref:RING finger and SPRY domain-containing n=1 Tax=Argiope bruennichi TaxID=94029 RepID=A0A8T0FAX6_ARGBR|nr:RING finger and SPRY domain-containing [Argiope bruennichi]
MGICVCKERQSESDEETITQPPRLSVNSLSAETTHVTPYGGQYDPVQRALDLMVSRQSVDKLVMETLCVIRTFVDNDIEPPPSMAQIHCIADKEIGWLTVVHSMANVIPMDDPLGPAVITLLLDECPLPSKESIAKLSKVFCLSKEQALQGKFNPTRHRNICVILGCIAEKLAGPSSIALLTQDAMDYLFTNLDPSMNTSVILFSLIALEKFAQTSVNKVTINQQLQSKPENPLERLEAYVNSPNYAQKQVGFCAQWCLDNLFIKEVSDVLGCLLNVEHSYVIFYLNGNQLPPCSQLFQNAKSGFFAAASFMSFQQCEFNFGRMPFKFPPANINFQCFNNCATLSDEEKIILPRHIRLEKLRQTSVKEDSCSLCFDGSATIRLDPCQHTGFCVQCALQLEVCPMCRSKIDERAEIG